MLRQAIQGISDLILVPGLINLDFADVKTIMSGMGLAMMGTGVAEGEDRAIEAARRAISSPLLEGASVNGARGVIINVTGGPDLSLVEVSDASTIVQEAADEDANIIFGAVVDPALKGKVKITVIATGFDAAALRGPAVGRGPDAGRHDAVRRCRARPSRCSAARRRCRRLPRRGCRSPAGRCSTFRSRRPAAGRSGRRGIRDSSRSTADRSTRPARRSTFRPSCAGRRADAVLDASGRTTAHDLTPTVSRSARMLTLLAMVE